MITVNNLSKPTQMTPVDMWLKPIEVAEHLGLSVTDGDGGA
jgi:hypothetical protein